MTVDLPKLAQTVFSAVQNRECLTGAPEKVSGMIRIGDVLHGVSNESKSLDDLIVSIKECKKPEPEKATKDDHSIAFLGDSIIRWDKFGDIDVSKRIALCVATARLHGSRPFEFGIMVQEYFRSFGRMISTLTLEADRKEGNTFIQRAITEFGKAKTKDEIARIGTQLSSEIEARASTQKPISRFMQQMKLYLTDLEKGEIGRLEADARLQAKREEVAKASFLERTGEDLTYSTGSALKGLGAVLLTKPQNIGNSNPTHSLDTIYIGIATMREPEGRGYSLFLFLGGPNTKIDRPTIDRWMEEAVSNLVTKDIKITSICPLIGRCSSKLLDLFKAWQNDHKHS